MRKSALILILAALFINLSFVSAALSIRIDTRNPSIGEEAGFDYSLVSDSDVDVYFTPTIKCLNLPEEILTIQQASLKAGVIYTGSDKGFIIEDETITQQCLARIRVSEPFVQVKEQEFFIWGKSEMAFYLKVCGDKNCNDESKLFVKNENVFIDYMSDVKDLNLVATLKYSDGKTQEIKMPTSIKASQIGTYDIEVTASKQGYKTITKKEQFGVIKENADIKLGSPQAYTVKDIGSGSRFMTIFAVVLILSILLVILIIYLYLRNKNKLNL